MTTPPNDPTGQNPYDPNRYGQPNPYEQQHNPYGQPDPYGQQNPYGQQPPAGQYGQDPYAADPYGVTGAQPPYGQYPQYAGGGGQFPPQPPNNSSGKWWWIGGGALVILAVVALVVGLTVDWGSSSSSSASSSTSTAADTTDSATSSAPTSADSGNQQTATDCTPNVSSGTSTNGNAVAGALSFPLSAAPGWSEYSDSRLPNAIGMTGVNAEVPGASWMMQAEVGTTNFSPSMSITDQATKLINCISNGPGYIEEAPTSLGPLTTTNIKVDGVDAVQVDGDVTVTGAKVPGDSVRIVVVQTNPVTFFFGATPIGDAANRAVIDRIQASLKVAKS